MGRRGGTFVQVFQFKITAVTADIIHKGNIAVYKFFNAEIIIAGIQVLVNINISDGGLAGGADPEFNCIITIIQDNDTPGFIPHRFNFLPDHGGELLRGGISIGNDAGMNEQPVCYNFC